MTDPGHDPIHESARETGAPDAAECGCDALACRDADVARSAKVELDAPPRRRAAVDLLEFDDRWEAFLDLPGVRRDDVDLLVDRGVLRVTATRRRAVPAESTVLRREIADATWDERFRLGEDVDRERIDASLVDGVLRVTLPRRDAALPRRIDVRTG